jgi:hypothetical protein
MSWFRREKTTPYDPEKQQPAVRRSYCTREMSLGFIDRSTGVFREYAAANSRRELEAFCRQYGVRPEDLKTIY